YHAPDVQYLPRTADAGVDQHRAAGMGDHEPVHRPGAAVQALQAGQVQPLDLQRHGRSPQWTGGLRRTTSTTAPTTRTPPPIMAGVSCSPRMSAPSRTAITGLTYA